MNPHSLILNPIEEIDKCFTQAMSENTHSNYNVDLSDHFNQSLFSQDLNPQIPDFSCFKCYADLKKYNAHLVKMTYMVQNIEDPEIFAHALAKKNQPSNFLNLKFRENLGPEVSAFDLDNDCVLSDRLSVYCVPIPWENSSCSNSNAVNTKIIEENQNQEEILKFQDVEIRMQDEISTFFGKLQQKKIFNSNNKHSFPVILKVYDSNIPAIKLNEVYEFVGILAYSPSALDEPTENEDKFESSNTHYPPHLVPRIHCLALRKLPENEIEEQTMIKIAKQLPPDFLRLPDIQKRLLNILNRITNDELVSFYILVGIINNSPHKKPEYLENIHKLVVNIYKASKIQYTLPSSNNVSITFPQILSRLLEKICQKSFYLPLDIESLETSLFISTKNYENNMLEMGKLQVTTSTVVCIDETRMTEGKLTEKGIKNLQFLNEFLESQTLAFDFSFHHLKVPCECNVIVCSEGKSFLKTNLNVSFEKISQLQMLHPQIAEFIEDSSSPEKECDLECFKYFILKAQKNLRNMKINEEVSKRIEEDYVQSRKASPSTIDTDSLQRWIITAKINSACEDSLELSFESYLRAKELDFTRLKRNN